MRTFLANILCMVTVGFLAMGCGSSSKTCTSICQDGQAAKCTDITGDCGQFCTALQNVSVSAGCVSQHDAYLSCAISAPTCGVDAQCASQKSAFNSCAGSYCLAHTTDANCQIIAGSF